MSPAQRIDTLADLIRVHGRDRASNSALELGDRQLTYGELDERSNRVAAALADAGTGPGDRIAVVAKNCLEFYELLFGAAKLGAVTVSVNWRLHPSEIAAIVQDCGARLLFASEEYLPVAADCLADTDVSAVRVFDSADPQVGFQVWADPHESVDPGHEAAPDDVALQFYTSGTTGLPKGVLTTQRNFFTRLGDLAEGWRMDDTSRVLGAMPSFHVGGTGWGLAALRAGGTLVLLSDVELAQVLDRLPTCTHAFLVPAVIGVLVNTPALADADLSALHTLVYAAAPISPTLLQSALGLFGCDFIQSYGLTESSGAVVELRAEDHDPDKRPGLLESCGRPYPWVEIRIIDPDSFGTGVVDGTTVKDALPGDVGEVWIRSVQVTPGYWNRPEETAATVTQDGWLRTGDAGYLDDQGYLYLCDRIKDMIVSGGENVYPVEIENVLAAHSGVTDVAVIGVPHDKWGETVKAIVVPGQEPRPTAEELIEFCRERVAHYKCPTSVDFVAELPRNPSGKILKRELRAPHWAGRSRRIS